ncbi:hypothetical protein DASC09_044900 [Saccharomycopsis crataegensis]|uniref:Reduced meiotic recombination protein 1 n=1 Tax=Saccharomycopsis crataegensis TaxID=43959 RepID=A0AAV5QQE8_9ASCO|nr:hypothetical protein DASC09_044900 [Saccharomycopsis crataegensis]
MSLMEPEGSVTDTSFEREQNMETKEIISFETENGQNVDMGIEFTDKHTDYANKYEQLIDSALYNDKEGITEDEDYQKSDSKRGKEKLPNEYDEVPDATNNKDTDLLFSNAIELVSENHSSSSPVFGAIKSGTDQTYDVAECDEGTDYDDVMIYKETASPAPYNDQISASQIYLEYPVVLSYEGGEYLGFRMRSGSQFAAHNQMPRVFDDAKIIYQKMELFFPSLRSGFISLGCPLSTAYELVLDFPDLGLALGEDNIYCMEVCFSDIVSLFNRLNSNSSNGSGVSTINIRITTKARFSSQFNRLLEIMNRDKGFDEVSKSRTKAQGELDKQISPSNQSEEIYKSMRAQEVEVIDLSDNEEGKHEDNALLIDDIVESSDKFTIPTTNSSRTNELSELKENVPAESSNSPESQIHAEIGENKQNEMVEDVEYDDIEECLKSDDDLSAKVIDVTTYDGNNREDALAALSSEELEKDRKSETHDLPGNGVGDEIDPSSFPKKRNYENDAMDEGHIDDKKPKI